MTSTLVHHNSLIGFMHRPTEQGSRRPGVGLEQPSCVCRVAGTGTFIAARGADNTTDKPAPTSIRDYGDAVDPERQTTNRAAIAQGRRGYAVIGGGPGPAKLLRRGTSLPTPPLDGNSQRGIDQQCCPKGVISPGRANTGPGPPRPHPQGPQRTGTQTLG